eukprot:767493-Hanusia_phi.AAC.1
MTFNLSYTPPDPGSARPGPAEIGLIPTPGDHGWADTSEPGTPGGSAVLGPEPRHDAAAVRAWIGQSDRTVTRTLSILMPLRAARRSVSTESPLRPGPGPRA